METEIFKPFPLAPLVLVGDMGTIIRPNGRKASKIPDNVGYLRLHAIIGGIPKPFKQHRIIAITWLDNPLNLSEVNHKDGNKLNNAVDNLEWCSHKDNIKHGRALGLWTKPQGRPKGYTASAATRLLMANAKKGRKRAGFRAKWL